MADSVSSRAGNASPDGLLEQSGSQGLLGASNSAVLAAIIALSIASFWFGGGFGFPPSLLLLPILTRWGPSFGVSVCYLCLVGWGCEDWPLPQSAPTLGEVAAVVGALLLTQSSPCCSQTTARDRTISGLSIFRLALRRWTSLPLGLFPSLLWLFAIGVWLYAAGAFTRAPAEESPGVAPVEGLCEASVWVQYLRLVAKLAEGSVTICDSRRRILWACPIAAAELCRAPVCPDRGLPAGEGSQGEGPFCEDLVHPEDRAALFRAFELAEEQQRKTAGRRGEGPTKTTKPKVEGSSGDRTCKDEEAAQLETPAVLVRVNPPSNREGPPRLFRVSVTQCGARNFFACLWRDATRLRRTAAVQEALVCGLSDCMSTVVWVFDPVAPQETADAAATSTWERAACSAAAAVPADRTGSPGEQGRCTRTHGWSSESTQTRGKPTCTATDYTSSSRCTFAEQWEESAARDYFSSAECPRHVFQLPRRGPQQHTKPVADTAQIPEAHGDKCDTSSNNVCTTSDVNVAPASLCPSVYRTKVSSSQTEKMEAYPRFPRPPRNVRGLNSHENFRQFTVAGGAPLLQIEKAGPLAFLLEHSKAILQRLTGRTVLGREPFSMLSSGDDRSPEEGQESSWTDFFLEPGKTQLLECVRRLRTKGMSFSVELPYERSDGSIRWFRVAGYCSAYMPGVMWGIMQDTTASRTRLGCAQRSLHQLKTLFEAEFCGLGIVDTADTGLIVETSAGLDDFLGASAVGRPSICLLPEPVEKLASLRGSCVGAPVVIQEREFPRAALHQVTVTAVLDSESPGDLLFALRDDRKKQSILGLQKIIHAMQS